MELVSCRHLEFAEAEAAMMVVNLFGAARSGGKRMGEYYHDLRRVSFLQR